MLVKTDAALERDARAKAIDEDRQRVMQWAAHVLTHSRVLDDEATDPTNVEKQFAEAMTCEEFEKKLLRVNPNFVFEEILNPDGTISKKCKRLQFRKPDGTLLYLGPYERGLIPKFSVHETRIEIVPDFTIERVSRKDLVNVRLNDYVEVDPETGDIRGEVYKVDEIPGVRKVRMPGRELVRGWVTVLVRIVLAGIASPEEIERVFGPIHSHGWQYYIGRTKEKPWIEK